MAYGIQNQIGIGKAQVLQGGQSNPMQIAEVYQQQQARKENQKRYDDAKAEQNEFNKIKIIGDALDPRNFNVHVHDKIRDAKLALMQDFKDTPLSDVAFKVQDYAGKIGYMSDQFNSLQKQMSDTRDYYKPYKEINTSAIADMALSDAVTEFKKTGQIDLTRNYFDEALNKNRKLALGSGSTGYIHDTLPDELVDYESEGQDKDGRGGGSMYKYKFKNVPAYYDVKENGRFAAPTVTTKGKEIEIGGQKVMALDDMAWERYKTNPVNHIRVLAEVEDKYGKNIDPETTEALARIEAYKNIDKYKPQPKITDRQFEPRAININVGSGGSDYGNPKKFDVLYPYEGSFKQGDIRVPSTNKNLLGKSVHKTISGKIIDASEVSADVKALFGKDVKPYKDIYNGKEYYLRRDNGDWEGMNNGNPQVISVDDVIKKEIDKAAVSKVKQFGRQEPEQFKYDRGATNNSNSKYVDIKVVNGQKWGKTKDGKIEKIN